MKRSPQSPPYDLIHFSGHFSLVKSRDPYRYRKPAARNCEGHRTVCCALVSSLTSARCWPGVAVVVPWVYEGANDCMLRSGRSFIYLSTVFGIVIDFWWCAIDAVIMMALVNKSLSQLRLFS